jgi:hypothetical protein
VRDKTMEMEKSGRWRRHGRAREKAEQGRGQGKREGRRRDKAKEKTR